MAVSATPTANRVAEPTHRLAISSRLLAPRPTSPRLPPQWVGRRPLRIWVKAEPNRMAAMAVPLTQRNGETLAVIGEPRRIVWLLSIVRLTIAGRYGLAVQVFAITAGG